MSTTSFYRYFKKELGMSPIEFGHTRKKIRHAKQLLKNPTIQIMKCVTWPDLITTITLFDCLKKRRRYYPKEAIPVTLR
jgi:transcriptional regulator GlxA family with amidase domain